MNDRMYIRITLTTVFDSHLSKRLRKVRQKYSAKSIKSKTKTQVTKPPHRYGGLPYFFIFLLTADQIRCHYHPIVIYRQTAYKNKE